MLAGDPDAHYALELAGAVPLGVEEILSCPSAVWPMKDHPEDSDEEMPDIGSRPNYPSAEKYEDDLWDQYIEDVSEKLAAGPFDSDAEAASFIGCQPQDLVHGALGVRLEKSKKRPLHDGTIIGINPRIRQNIQVKGQCPMAPDMAHAAAVHRDTSSVRLALFQADISKAHKRFKISRKDWRYLTAKVKQKTFVNMVGVYGVSSMQFYWGRIFGLVVRILYYLGLGEWWFVYVDDLAGFIEVHRMWPQAATVLMVLLILGCPLSWHKLFVGLIGTWTGLRVDLQLYTFSPHPDKREEILPFLLDVISGKALGARHIKSYVAKLSWYAQTFSLIHPFLQPFFAWSEAVLHAGRPGVFLRAVAQAIVHLIQECPVSPACFFRPHPGCGGTDAKATSSQAVVGGWWSAVDPPTKENCQWFSFELAPSVFPWLFKEGDPKRCIGALELLGNTLLLKMVASHSPGIHSAWRFTARTDNQSNAYALQKSYSRTFPSCAVLMEHVVTAHKSHIHADFVHVLRDENTWADDLTNSNFIGWSTNRRWTPDISASEFFYVLNDIVKLF
jgi:hypothetical protein